MDQLAHNIWNLIAIAVGAVLLIVLACFALAAIVGTIGAIRGGFKLSTYNGQLIRLEEFRKDETFHQFCDRVDANWKCTLEMYGTDKPEDIRRGKVHVVAN